MRLQWVPGRRPVTGWQVARTAVWGEGAGVLLTTKMVQTNAGCQGVPAEPPPRTAPPRTPLAGRNVRGAGPSVPRRLPRMRNVSEGGQGPASRAAAPVVPHGTDGTEDA